MIELLAGYSIAQIIIFLIVFFLAVKEGVTIFEFFYSRSKKHFEDGFDEEQEKEDMKKDIEALYKAMQANDEKFSEINTSLQDIKQFCQEGFEHQGKVLKKLTESDRDNIKSFIVKEYHHFIKDVGWIDDFSLDVLEKRYTHYVDEGGNSYVEGLMKELRALPKHDPNK